MKKLSLLFLVLPLGNALAQQPTTLMNSHSAERLYAVHSRHNDVTHRVELGLGGGYMINSDDYIRSRQIDLNVRYYWSPRWFTSVSGAYASNVMSTAGERLYEHFSIIPDAAYVKYRAEIQMGYNLFYGKFRMTSDRIFYFDQYIAVGPGIVNLNTGTPVSGTADIGIAGWMGDSFSLRLGIKNYVYYQTRQLSEGMTTDMVGYLQMGCLL